MEKTVGLYERTVDRIVGAKEFAATVKSIKEESDLVNKIAGKMASKAILRLNAASYEIYETSMGINSLAYKLKIGTFDTKDVLVEVKTEPGDTGRLNAENKEILNAALDLLIETLNQAEKDSNAALAKLSKLGKELTDLRSQFIDMK